MSPRRTRRRYTAGFKAEVARAALTERQLLAELVARYPLAPAQITRWKQRLRQQALLQAGCRVSRDGRDRATDNALGERFWRTVKWAHLYLNPADDGQQLFCQLQAYSACYNHQRPPKPSRRYPGSGVHDYSLIQAFLKSFISPAEVSKFWRAVHPKAAPIKLLPPP